MENEIIIKTSLSEKDIKDIYELAKSKYMKTFEMLCSYIDGMSIIDLKNKEVMIYIKLKEKEMQLAKTIIISKTNRKKKRESIDN